MSETLAPSSLSLLRASMAGRRVAIVHYGEDTPLDDGYRPVRMGQLAQWLTEAGADVTRIVPSFSASTRTNRPVEWSNTETREGLIKIVPTTAYSSTRGRERFQHITDLCRGTAQVLGQMEPMDAAVVGYPPPGLVRSVRRAAGPETAIVADIRDLWPDALSPSDRPAIHSLASRIGRGMAQELRLADGVVAMSDVMLERAPNCRRLSTIPLSASRRFRPNAGPLPEGPMVATYVGSLANLFDFRSLILGWRRFIHQRPQRKDQPTLRIVGSGAHGDEIARLADGEPTIRLVGHRPASEIPSWLETSDIGIVPTRTGHGTTLSNKVLEYVGSGNYMIHSLVEAVGRQLVDFGTGIDSSEEAWEQALHHVEGRLMTIRGERNRRIGLAEQRFGREAVEPQWLSEIVSLIEQKENRR